MAYIIVSDVHLGGKLCNQKEFCDFLKWVRGLVNRTETIKCKGKDVTIHSPEKFILLGDILELWDPKDGNRDNVIGDGILPFSVLSDINCDKIYVIGNHDDSLSELEDEVDNVALPNGTKFDIYDRHYPEKEEKTGISNGIKIGSRSYFFLHGHQFDKEQAILAWVSRLIGESWNPLGWFQDLFNTLFTKKHWKASFLVFSALFIGGGYYWNKFLPSSFPNALTWASLTGTAGSLIYLIVSAIVLLFFLMKGFFALTAALFVILLGGRFFWEQSSFLAIIWGTLTGFFALSSIPGVVASTQRKFYNLFKSKDKTVEKIIHNGYYRKDKDTIRADVVVFGHTHFADFYGPNTDTGNRLFINSGCWYGKDKLIDKKMRYSNTFIYIDDSGAYILRWRSFGNIECIEAFPEG